MMLQPSFILSTLTSEKPTGSKFFDVFSPQLKGMGSGPSLPTIPLANSFNDEVLVEMGAGAKAAAELAMTARMEAVNLAMVDDNLVVDLVLVLDDAAPTTAAAILVAAVVQVQIRTLTLHTFTYCAAYVVRRSASRRKEKLR
jgi:hypothetical protein